MDMSGFLGENDSCFNFVIKNRWFCVACNFQGDAMSALYITCKLHGGIYRMSEESERRKFKRYDYTTPVEIRYENQGDVYPGIMSNYSSKGMCIQTEIHIDASKSIYIRMKEYHPGRKGVNAYEWYSASVMWEKTSDPQEAAYAIGVQFPQPLLY